MTEILPVLTKKLCVRLMLFCSLRYAKAEEFIMAASVKKDVSLLI